jgi:serine-type D-Ala-D-Ala endopeptidase (penicillin-binding protein 7)
MNHSEKITFLFVLVAGIFFARVMYPNLAGIPQFSVGDRSQVASAATEDASLLAGSSQASLASNNAFVPSTSVSTSSNEPSIAGVSVFSRSGNSAVPSFTSDAYLVADLSSGTALAGVNASSRWPTASITKLMTATIAFENIPTSTRITITPAMFSADPTEQTLVVGGTYTVEDLLHLLLMPSSNVAAEALAGYLGRTQFLAEMNSRAQQWGMPSTYFQDPSGISAANESTANDLLVLAQHIYQEYPGILAITDTPVTTITELNSGKKITVHSINVFAGEPIFIGGKTGNTPQAGGNLLSLFNYKGHPVFIVVLGAPSLPFSDTSALYNWFRQNFK